jgi:sporulation protein YlmC with PRC-barrel domain
MSTKMATDAMLRSARHLIGYTCRGTDGDVGKVDDLFLDDLSWAVRYFVVRAGNWLVGRQVLISPVSLHAPNWITHTLPVELNKEQIKDSPPIEADQPVSRQVEHRVATYYGWPMYWGGPATATMAVPTVEELPLRDVEERPRDPHLRSVKELCGYHIHARDGMIGHVDDLIIEDAGWHVRYIVVDTRNWLPGRKVLVAPHWFTDINWNDRSVTVELDTERVKNSPPYDPAAPVNRAYEERLYDFYGRPAYWQ